MTERDIFIAALQEEDPAQRRAYLDKACGQQVELRRQVENLLMLHEGARSFLEAPAAESATAWQTGMNISRRWRGESRRSSQKRVIGAPLTSSITK